MTLTSKDMDQLNELMAQSPGNKALLKKLMESYEYSISQISHELRNPLSLVYSTLQLIESNHPEVSKIKHWHHMKEDVEYMTALLEDLSKHNNSRHLKLSEFNFRSFMEHTALTFASSLIDTDIEFISKIDPLLPIVKADRLKLQEVFLNLLKNARDAVDTYGKIKLDAYLKSSEIIITVSDTGCGIANEQLEEIFTPFVTHKQNGTGLGLAIVHEVLNAHKGSISVQSVPKEGTVFTAVIPI